MYQIVLTPGAVPCTYTKKRAQRYGSAVVSEVDASGKVIRIIAAEEYLKWGDGPPQKLQSAVSEKKPAPKKKKANKQSAIPDKKSELDDLLETVDVSDI